METTLNIVSFTLLIGLLLSPVLIAWRLHRLRLRHTCIIYLTSSLLTTAAMALAFAYWADTSDKMLLAHYGYDFDAMNDTERYEKVSPDHMESVKSIESRIMGIGWPLKAIVTYAFYTPYVLLVSVGAYLYLIWTKKGLKHSS